MFPKKVNFIKNGISSQSQEREFYAFDLLDLDGFFPKRFVFITA